MTAEIQAELLNEVIRCAMFAADQAVIGKEFRTHADETLAAVTAAFHLALGNGLIHLTPRDDWPEYVSLTPPYGPPPSDHLAEETTP